MGCREGGLCACAVNNCCQQGSKVVSFILLSTLVLLWLEPPRSTIMSLQPSPMILPGSRECPFVLQEVRWGTCDDSGSKLSLSEEEVPRRIINFLETAVADATLIFRHETVFNAVSKIIGGQRSAQEERQIQRILRQALKGLSLRIAIDQTPELMDFGYTVRPSEGNTDHVLENIIFLNSKVSRMEVGGSSSESGVPS